jgi:signal transduction histidine kinase
MRFRDLPIKSKLRRVILLTSSLALLIAYTAFMLVDIYASRTFMVRDLDVVAKIVAINTTAALSFENQADATETLDVLSAEPQISGAWLYNDRGQLFASYSKGPIQGPASLGKRAAGHRFTLQGLILVRPVMLNQRQIGTLCIEASLSEFYARLGLYAGIVLLAFLGAFLAAYATSIKFRAMIADPILGLASIANLISKEANYSFRALQESQDEIGLFTEAFNQMLSVIEEREKALQKGTLELKEQIAARIQAEEQLKALNEELEQRVVSRTQELLRSNQELEQFAYVASHDLQEPLRMVASYMQLLESRYQGHLDADADKFISFAVDGAKRMQALLQGLLAYSRVGSQGKTFQAASCEDLLQSVTADLHLVIKETGAEITHAPLPTVYADPVQLAQLFQNLLANALKFRADKPPRIHLGAELCHGIWTFSVKDNGIGINPQFFERIFIIFQRLHSRAEYPGTGIGLALCRKIVERHGGNIWVESEPGHGSTFFFTIPVASRT